MTSVRRRPPVCSQLLACALTLSACTSGIKVADQACSPNRTKASAFAECLRNNYATLTSGPNDDLGSLYLAEAEDQAAQVASGSETDGQAMLNIAYFKMKVITPVEKKRQDEAVQKIVDAMKAGQNQSGSGAQQRSQSYARSSPR